MEKKVETSMTEKRSSIGLEDRKTLTLTGVLEVINFDEQKILLNTTLGTLTLKGSGLKMKKLDVQNGDVIIQGYINSMAYSGKREKVSKENIIGRIFK